MMLPLMFPNSGIRAKGSTRGQPARGGACSWPGHRGSACGQPIEEQRPQRRRLLTRCSLTLEMPPVGRVAAGGANTTAYAGAATATAQ
ncbi:hypothetical protein GW17_00047952 [Ensete ventricosum]|nr:hypothetical protein GW17_00047952 [Ensete ventricosum]